MPNEPLVWVAAALTAVLGVARITRLTAEDTWPPMSALRNLWIKKFNTSEWAELAVCPFCQAPYHALVAGIWAWLSGFHWTWWVFYGWLAVSYVAAMIVARDIPNASGE